MIAFYRISLSYNGNEQVKAGTGKYAYVMSIPELKKYFANQYIFAKYTTENMQINKDGDKTVRVSLYISKNRDLLMQSINEYNKCTKYMIKSGFENYVVGTWRDFEEL